MNGTQWCQQAVPNYVDGMLRYPPPYPHTGSMVQASNFLPQGCVRAAQPGNGGQQNAQLLQQQMSNGRNVCRAQLQHYIQQKTGQNSCLRTTDQFLPHAQVAHASMPQYQMAHQFHSSQLQSGMHLQNYPPALMSQYQAQVLASHSQQRHQEQAYSHSVDNQSILRNQTQASISANQVQGSFPQYQGRASLPQCDLSYQRSCHELQTGLPAQTQPVYPQYPGNSASVSQNVRTVSKELGIDTDRLNVATNLQSIDLSMTSVRGIREELDYSNNAIGRFDYEPASADDVRKFGHDEVVVDYEHRSTSLSAVNYATGPNGNSLIDYHHGMSSQSSQHKAVQPACDNNKLLQQNEQIYPVTSIVTDRAEYEPQNLAHQYHTERTRLRWGQDTAISQTRITPEYVAKQTDGSVSYQPPHTNQPLRQRNDNSSYHQPQADLSTVSCSAKSVSVSAADLNSNQSSQVPLQQAHPMPPLIHSSFVAWSQNFERSTNCFSSGLLEYHTDRSDSQTLENAFVLASNKLMEKNHEMSDPKVGRIAGRSGVGVSLDVTKKRKTRTDKNTAVGVTASSVNVDITSSVVPSSSLPPENPQTISLLEDLLSSDDNFRDGYLMSSKKTNTRSAMQSSLLSAETLQTRQVQRLVNELVDKVSLKCANTDVRQSLQSKAERLMDTITAAMLSENSQKTSHCICARNPTICNVHCLLPSSNCSQLNSEVAKDHKENAESDVGIMKETYDCPRVCHETPDAEVPKKVQFRDIYRTCLACEKQFNTSSQLEEHLLDHMQFQMDDLRPQEGEDGFAEYDENMGRQHPAQLKLESEEKSRSMIIKMDFKNPHSADSMPEGTSEVVVKENDGCNEASILHSADHVKLEQTVSHIPQLGPTKLNSEPSKTGHFPEEQNSSMACTCDSTLPSVLCSTLCNNKSRDQKTEEQSKTFCSKSSSKETEKVPKQKPRYGNGHDLDKTLNKCPEPMKQTSHTPKSTVSELSKENSTFSQNCDPNSVSQSILSFHSPSKNSDSSTPHHLEVQAQKLSALKCSDPSVHTKRPNTSKSDDLKTQMPNSSSSKLDDPKLRLPRPPSNILEKKSNVQKCDGKTCVRKSGHSKMNDLKTVDQKPRQSKLHRNGDKSKSTSQSKTQRQKFREAHHLASRSLTSNKDDVNDRKQFMALSNGQIFKVRSRSESDQCNYFSQCVTEELRKADFEDSNFPDAVGFVNVDSRKISVDLEQHTPVDHGPVENLPSEAKGNVHGRKRPHCESEEPKKCDANLAEVVKDSAFEQTEHGGKIPVQKQHLSVSDLKDKRNKVVEDPKKSSAKQDPSANDLMHGKQHGLPGSDSKDCARKKHDHNVGDSAYAEGHNNVDVGEAKDSAKEHQWSSNDLSSVGRHCTSASNAEETLKSLVQKLCKPVSVLLDRCSVKTELLALKKEKNREETRGECFHEATTRPVVSAQSESRKRLDFKVESNSPAKKLKLDNDRPLKTEQLYSPPRNNVNVCESLERSRTTALDTRTCHSDVDKVTNDCNSTTSSDNHNSKSDTNDGDGDFIFCVKCMTVFTERTVYEKHACMQICSDVGNDDSDTEEEEDRASSDRSRSSHCKNYNKKKQVVSKPNISKKAIKEKCAPSGNRSEGQRTVSKTAKISSKDQCTMFRCDRCDKIFSSRGGLLFHWQHFHKRI